MCVKFTVFVHVCAQLLIMTAYCLILCLLSNHSLLSFITHKKFFATKFTNLIISLGIRWLIWNLFTETRSKQVWLKQPTWCTNRRDMPETTHLAYNRCDWNPPGKMSLRLTAGLLVSMVSLWTAAFTGNTGCRTNLAGRWAFTIITRRPPVIHMNMGKKNHLWKTIRRLK